MVSICNHKGVLPYSRLDNLRYQRYIPICIANFRRWRDRLLLVIRLVS